MGRDSKGEGRVVTRRDALALLGGAAVSGMLSACGTAPVAPPPAPPTSPSRKEALHYAGLLDVARMIEARELSPVELTEKMLERINAVDGRTQAYVTLTAHRALAAARQAEAELDAGVYRGPLHGVPVAVKDLVYTRGARTMGGMAGLRSFVPSYDATVVSRMEAAGAVLLGKLNLTEGAMAGYHPDFEIPRNPWDDDYWTGASSSGSGVATAAGLCFASLGTDTGGSIRFPAMANGIVGLKPTYGRVSRHGVLALAESMDHVGPMTRRTADTAVVFQAIAGYDENDPTTLREPVPDMRAALGGGVRGLRIGIDRRLAAAGTDAGLVEAIEEALSVLRRLGATVIDLPMPPQTVGVGDVWFALCAAEAVQAHAVNFPSRADLYGPAFRDFLEFGASVTPEQYAQASEFRSQYSRSLEAVLSQVDAMVLPAGGHTVPVTGVNQHGDIAALRPLFEAAQMQFTIPANFAGTPALTLPCGFSRAGLPYALQFMGSKLAEPLLCRIGHSYEEATRWHERHPSI